MANIKKESVVRIYTTPDELHKLANEMEAFWKKCQWVRAQSSRSGMAGVQIHSVCDQAKIPGNEHGLGR